jgi:hypothetical protein
MLPKIHTAWFVFGLLSLSIPASGQGHDSLEGFPPIAFDHRAIRYMDLPLDDPVARLEQRVAKGQVKLAFQTNGWGHLADLLKHLGVNPDSQVLVFSKTSTQAAKISPRTPRAIYFSDDVAVGLVPEGDVLELAALDSRQGYVFYTVDSRKPGPRGPDFVRRGIECLQCHLGPATLNVPGPVVSTAFAGPDGTRTRGGAFVTDHRTPLPDRWGGWYVTGTHGSQTHNGNAIVPDPAQPKQLDRRASLNVTDLAGRLNLAPYPRPTSDLVALMTLEHQTTMTNLITRLGWETRVAQQEGKLAAFGPRLDELAGDLVEYMLFLNEWPLRAPVKGVSTFTQTFAQRGPRDRQGRSLRDFDLQKRLFRYPVSYMIYSAAFDGLPAMARERVLKRLYDSLTGQTGDKQGKLSAADRRAALEILRETKANLPAYWRTP